MGKENSCHLLNAVNTFYLCDISIASGMKIANYKLVQLIQIFLPLYDNNKREFDRALYDDLRTRLKDQFGGVTFYRNAPAEGLWKDETGKTNFDELVIAEVMIAEINEEWWRQFKQHLEQIFYQEEILIRSILFEKL
jgi:hypothetical protein